MAKELFKNKNISPLQSVYKLRKKYNSIKIGNKVTTNTPIEAFGYEGVYFYPEMIGIVAAIKSPNVRYSDAWKDEAVVVDFELSDKTHRCRIWYQHVEAVTE